MKVRYKLLSKVASAPVYKTDGAAGADLFAAECVKVYPGKHCMIPLGVAFEIPEGYYGELAVRSSLGVKTPLFIPIGYGVIDSDYRGEAKLIVSNDSKYPYTVNAGDRVAQIIFHKYEKAELVESEELSSTGRGDGGFGSTGKN